MKNILIFILFILSAININSQSDSVSFLNSETRNYDQIHIKLNLSFDFDEEKVNGNCEFSFSPLVNDFNELILHAKTMNVNSVSIAGRDLNFRQDEQHLFITMDKNYSEYDSLIVSIN